MRRCPFSLPATALACLALAAVTTAPGRAAPTQGPPVAAHHAPHRHAARHKAAPAQPASLHRPPAPGGLPAIGAAPVPDENVAAPRDRQDARTSVAPSIFKLHYPTSGDGYIGGSSPSAIDNEHAAEIGGVQVQVPLH